MWNQSYFDLVWRLSLISGGIDDQVPKFAITGTKLYVPVVDLLTKENVKLLTQLKSGF